jgi:hypothetical protein
VKKRRSPTLLDKARRELHEAKKSLVACRAMFAAAAARHGEAFLAMTTARELASKETRRVRAAEQHLDELERARAKR